MRVDARVAQQRDEVLQDLRDAAAVGRRVDVQHAAPGGRSGECPQPVIALLADHLGVIGETLGADLDVVQED